MNSMVMQPVRLTDGSIVYNLHLSDVLLHCCSERDARALAEKISAAIDAHTLENGTIQWFDTASA